jgi:hypothetical protein
MSGDRSMNLDKDTDDTRFAGKGKKQDNQEKKKKKE